jgi:hypothetical protein
MAVFLRTFTLLNEQHMSNRAQSGNRMPEDMNKKYAPSVVLVS